MFATVFSAYAFYTYDFPKPSIWIAVVAVVLKYSWGVIFVIFLVGLAFKYGWFLADVFNYPGWRVLGKISYSCYIFHIFVVKIFIIQNHSMLDAGILNTVRKYIKTCL